MKKIFSIIAAVMSGLVIVLLVTTCFIKTNAADAEYVRTYVRITPKHVICAALVRSTAARPPESCAEDFGLLMK